MRRLRTAVAVACACGREAARVSATQPCSDRPGRGCGRSGLLLSGWNPALALQVADVVHPIGKLWLNALQMTVVPLVLALVVVGVNTASDAAASGRIARRAIVVFIVILTGGAVFAALAAPQVFSLFAHNPGPDRGAGPWRRARGSAGRTPELGRCADRDRAQQRDHGRGAKCDVAAGGVCAVPRLRADPHRAGRGARCWWNSSRRLPTR